MHKASRTVVRVAAALAITSLSTLGIGCGKDAEPTTADAKAEAGKEAPSEPDRPPLTAAELEELYRTSKARFEATEKLPDESFAEIEGDLRRVANEAEDVHLRANASLLLGHMYEARADQRTAVSFYRQAAELLPDDVDVHIVLALALAKAERWDEAIAEQWKVVNAIPDELMGWLLLGELHVKGGKLDEAAKVYGAYEMRRKGLIDGLTAKHEGEYVVDENERAACAGALAPAVDNGTSLALMYALDSDPSPLVREQVARIMGEQRLVGYAKLLGDKLAGEPDPKVEEAIEWAIAEIEREGLETAPGPVPAEIAEQVEAEAKALAEEEAEKQANKAEQGGDAQPPPAEKAGKGEGEAD